MATVCTEKVHKRCRSSALYGLMANAVKSMFVFPRYLRTPFNTKKPQEASLSVFVHLRPPCPDAMCLGTKQDQKHLIVGFPSLLGFRARRKRELPRKAYMPFILSVVFLSVSPTAADTAKHERSSYFIHLPTQW